MEKNDTNLSDKKSCKKKVKLWARDKEQRRFLKSFVDPSLIEFKPISEEVIVEWEEKIDNKKLTHRVVLSTLSVVQIVILTSETVPIGYTVKIVPPFHPLYRESEWSNITRT